MRSFKIMAVLLILCWFIAPAVYAGGGLIRMKSPYTVKETADRLENILREKGMKVFIRIDHAGGAKAAGEQLRPTELVIFGNPKVGTPFMRCGQSVAIDLPQKALIWEDEMGQAWLAYNDPRFLAKRHGITGCHEVVQKIGNALSKFAHEATEP